MDTNGGVLNYEGVEALHAIDTRGIPNEPSLLPSSSSIKFSHIFQSHLETDIATRRPRNLSIDRFL